MLNIIKIMNQTRSFRPADFQRANAFQIPDQITNKTSKRITPGDIADNDSNAMF